MSNEPNIVLRETAAVADLSPVEQIEAALSGEMASRSKVILNIQQELLAVPADRIRLHLREYEDRLRARASWQAPAGVMVSLVAALVASDFKQIGLTAATWEALFVLGALLCAGLLARNAIRAFRKRSRGNDIEVLIENLRRSGP